MMSNSTRALVNVIIGILLIIVGIVWYIVKIPYVTNYITADNFDFYPFYEILILFFVGVFGVCLFFSGLILAWMGWDDYKMEKEMADEEETEEEVEEEVSTEEQLEAELREDMGKTGKCV